MKTFSNKNWNSTPVYTEEPRYLTSWKKLGRVLIALAFVLFAVYVLAPLVFFALSVISVWIRGDF